MERERGHGGVALHYALLPVCVTQSNGQFCSSTLVAGNCKVAIPFPLLSLLFSYSIRCIPLFSVEFSVKYLQSRIKIIMPISAFPVLSERFQRAYHTYLARAEVGGGSAIKFDDSSIRIILGLRSWRQKKGQFCKLGCLLGC